MCPHTTIYVSSYYCMCPHTTIYVSSYYYVCFLILLCMCKCAGAAAPVAPERYAPVKNIFIFFLQVVRMRGSCCTSSTCTICTSNSSFDSSSGNRGSIRPAVANAVAALWSWSCCTSSACTIRTSKALATAALTTSAAVEGVFRGLRQQQQTREYYARSCARCEKSD